MDNSLAIRRRGLVSLAVAGAVSLGFMFGPVRALAEESSEVVITEAGDTQEQVIVAAETGNEVAEVAQTPQTPETQEVSPEAAATPTEQVAEESTADDAAIEQPAADATTEQAEAAVSEDASQSEETVPAEQNDEQVAAADAAAATAESTEATDQDATPVSKEDDAELKPAAGGPIADGTYMFSSEKNKTTVLDVRGNSSKSGANVQVYTANGSVAQRWDVRYVMDGFYNIFKHGTNLALAVHNDAAVKRTNVELATKSDTDGQLWSFVAAGNGFYNIVSRLASNLVLDLTNGSVADATNVRIYDKNDSAAQHFKLFSAETADKSNVNLANGTYEMRPRSGSAYSIDIKAGSKANGANVQLYKANGSEAQTFHIDSDGKGYYVISVFGSGKVLSAVNAVPFPGSNVVQTSYTGADTQKWSLQKTSNGYELVNKATNLALDINSGKYQNGRNVQTYTRNNSAAQRYNLNKIYAISDGIYKITSAKDTSKVLDVKGSSAKNGAVIHLYASNDSLAQRFEVIRISKESDELYFIRTASSGGLLSYKNGKVTQYGNHETAQDSSNTWSLVWNGTYFSMKNVQSGKVLDLKAGKTDNGTIVQMYKTNGTTAQHFRFSKANLLLNGTYILNSAVGTVLDVKAGSTATGANIQTYTNNKSQAQRFALKATSGTSNTYVITNGKSGLAVTVADTSKENGVNVYQRANTNAATQQWEARISDGGYIMFVNKQSGKTLAVKGGSSTPGANVQQYEITYNPAQKWRPQAIEWQVNGNRYTFTDWNGRSTNWNETTYKAWNKIKNMTSGSRYLAAVDLTACDTNIFIIQEGGLWAPHKSWACSVGDESVGHGTPTGTFSAPAKKARFHTADIGIPIDGGVYYWTWFRDATAFHSVIYTTYNMTLLDGRMREHCTGGCVRLALENAKWMYDNFYTGSTTHVYY